MNTIFNRTRVVLSMEAKEEFCLVDSCSRTARNNTPSKALLFHQTLSTPKAGYIGWVPSSAPKGELE